MLYGVDRKKNGLSPLSLLSLALGLALLGATTAEARTRTVLVSPVPGNAISSGTALQNALAGIASPSRAHRWLLKIGPGIYDIGSTPLRMRSWVDIQGSGIGVTTIRGSVGDFNGTVHGANNAKLSQLTVEAVGSVHPGPIAMVNDLASPHLYRVKFSTTPGGWGTVWGIRNINAVPRIKNCEISVTGLPAKGVFAYGLVFRNDICFPIRIDGSIINVNSGGTSYGIYLEGNWFFALHNSDVNSFGGETTLGIFQAKGNTSTQSNYGGPEMDLWPMRAADPCKRSFLR